MMRIVLGLVVIALAAFPAWAKDFALPKKNPAVTLTIPDTWDTDVRDTEIVSRSADGDVTFTIGFEPRNDRETLVKDTKAYLQNNKVNLKVEPVRQTMDFAGTPGQVLRYNTTDKSGKTVIDLVSLDASRDRAVQIMIWASEKERQANDDDLSTIMKSIKLPANANSDSFWSGGAAKAPGAPEAKIAAAPASPTIANAAPFIVRRVLFNKREAQDVGDVETRTSQAFTLGEKLYTYIELGGQTTEPAGSGKMRFGIVADYEVRDSQGKRLGGQNGLLDRDFTVDAGAAPTFFINGDVKFTSIVPGDYVLVYMLHDKVSGRTTQTEQPFTMVNAPVPSPTTAAEQEEASSFCNNSKVRALLVETVNASDAFKDGKRRLKELNDPSLVAIDKSTRGMTCRYASVWAESQESGIAERRMMMTYTVTKDAKGDMDIDYKFER